MKKLHELHCKDGAGTVDIKRCKQNIATLARPINSVLTLLHSEWPKLYEVLAILSAIGLNSGVAWLVVLGLKVL